VDDRRLRLVDGRWTAALLVISGTTTLVAGRTSVPAFVAFGLLTLVGTAYAAYHWPRATLVAVAVTTLLDPAVAVRMLPRSIADGPIGVSEPLLLVAGLVALTRAGRTGVVIAARDPTIMLAGGFVGVSIVSAVVNRVPPHVAVAGIVMTVDAMAIFFVWRALRPSPEAGVRAMTAIVAAGVAVALFGIGQVVVAPNLLGFERFALRPGDVGRITSILGNPNLLAPILAFLLPFPIFAAVRLADRRHRAIALAAALILLVALALTFSRGSWIAAALGIGLGALLVDWRGLLAALGVAAVAAVIVVALPHHLVASDLEPPNAAPAASAPAVEPSPDASTPPATPPPTPAPPDPFAGMSSEEIRLTFLGDGLHIVRDNLVLGVGPGRYGGAVAKIFPSPVYEEYGTTIGHFRTVHNFWLHLVVEVGVVGVTLVLTIVVALVIRFARTARRSTGPVSVVLAGAATAAIVASLNSTTEMVLEGNIPAVLLWLVLGIGAALAPDPGLGLLRPRRSEG
jgi:O-antigen ligase